LGRRVIGRREAGNRGKNPCRKTQTKLILKKWERNTKRVALESEKRRGGGKKPRSNTEKQQRGRGSRGNQREVLQLAVGGQTRRQQERKRTGTCQKRASGGRKEPPSDTGGGVTAVEISTGRPLCKPTLHYKILRAKAPSPRRIKVRLWEGPAVQTTGVVETRNEQANHRNKWTGKQKGLC